MATPEYTPSPSRHVREQVAEYEASGGTRGNTMRGKPVIILTTRGARSGTIRKTPLMRVEHEGSYAVIASQGGAPAHPQWFHNVTAHPVDVLLQDGPEPHAFDVHVAEGAERDLWWQRAVAAWPDYASYQQKTDRRIPVVVLTPR
jgi:deazaflavin-dependent oxidoreductase (nitroreductase family)